MSKAGARWLLGKLLRIDPPAARPPRRSRPDGRLEPVWKHQSRRPDGGLRSVGRVQRRVSGLLKLWRWHRYRNAARSRVLVWRGRRRPDQPVRPRGDALEQRKLRLPGGLLRTDLHRRRRQYQRRLAVWRRLRFPLRGPRWRRARTGHVERLPALRARRQRVLRVPAGDKHGHRQRRAPTSSG